MRVTLLTTVAAATLSLSVAAWAQTGSGSAGSSGASGGNAPAAGAGSSTSGTTGAPTPLGSGSGNTSSNGVSGVPAGTTGNTSGATGSNAAGTAAGTSTGASGSTASGNAANTTGSTTGSTSINVTTEQRTQITESFRSVDVQPLNNVNFNVSVGTVIPTSVTTLYDCPNTVERILTGLPECKYVVVRDQVVIVEPSTRRIVTVIERRG